MLLHIYRVFFPLGHVSCLVLRYDRIRLCAYNHCNNTIILYRKKRTNYAQSETIQLFSYNPRPLSKIIGRRHSSIPRFRRFRSRLGKNGPPTSREKFRRLCQGNDSDQRTKPFEVFRVARQQMRFAYTSTLVSTNSLLTSVIAIQILTPQRHMLRPTAHAHHGKTPFFLRCRSGYGRVNNQHNIVHTGHNILRHRQRQLPFRRHSGMHLYRFHMNRNLSHFHSQGKPSFDGPSGFRNTPSEEQSWPD